MFDAAPLAVDIWIEDVQVCPGGAAVPHDEPALAKAVAGRSSTPSACPAGRHRGRGFFSDLSHQYVTINAEYTT